jgi:hypothetical protein
VFLLLLVRLVVAAVAVIVMMQEFISNCKHSENVLLWSMRDEQRRVVRKVEPIRDNILRRFVAFETAKLADSEAGNDEAQHELFQSQMKVAKTDILNSQTEYGPWEKLHPLCYCALSGTIGAQSVLMSKAVMSLLATTIGTYTLDTLVRGMCMPVFACVCVCLCVCVCVCVVLF